MTLYTRTGDSGETSFVGGERIRKDDIRIEAYGTLDELNASIGVTLAFVEDEQTRKILATVQNDLFTLGAELASISSKAQSLTKPLPVTTEDHVDELEQLIDSLESTLPMQKNFILPGGTTSASFLHLCRTTCRRAERLVVKLTKYYDLNPEILRYINRLSSLFHVLSRHANKELVKEQQPIYKYFSNKQEE